MKPIRVLHIINNLNTGGAQVCLREIVNNNMQGIENYIYTLRPDSGKFSFDATIFDSGYRNYDIRKFFFLVKLCKVLNIDIVHAHLHKACMLAIFLKYFYPCKVVLHEHGSIVSKGITFTAYRFLLRLLAGKVDCFVAVSNNMKDKITSIIGSSRGNVRRVYNSVDTLCFKPDLQARSEFRAKFGISDNDIVIGFIGRLSWVKGVDIAINAFNIAKQKCPNIKLLIVGDGTDEKKLKQQASQSLFTDDIIFTGFCDAPEKAINAFDIAVVPSRCEAFGIVVLELLACKVPVIGSSADGIKEIITDRVDGIITDNYPVPIASKIIDLINKTGLVDDIKKAGLVKPDKFSLDSYVANINLIYKDLLRRD